MPETPRPVLVIACGALAREIVALKARYGWQHLHLTCLNARLHNSPAAIPDRLRQAIRRHRAGYEDIFVAYADCGTGGGIDRVLEEEGAARLEGAHCYEFYAGAARFAALSSEEPGTFYLTDFLARHFERLVIEPLGLGRHPELRDAYFGNYRRLVYLSQVPDAALVERARRAAARLGLEFAHSRCGYGGLESGLATFIGRTGHGPQNSRLLA